MVPENNSFKGVETTPQIESLASVTDRVVRKKDQQKKDDKHKKKKNKQQNIDEQLEEEMSNENNIGDKDGHIDFHA